MRGIEEKEGEDRVGTRRGSHRGRDLSRGRLKEEEEEEEEEAEKKNRRN